jgi:type IV pilus assembly protein PilC
MAVTYSYKGILGNKYTEGKIVAINKDEAAFKLKEDRIIITSLEKVSGPRCPNENLTHLCIPVH